MILEKYWPLRRRDTGASHVLREVKLVLNAVFFIVFLNEIAFQKLESLNQFPDFNNYLIFVLTKLKSEGKRAK